MRGLASPYANVYVCAFLFVACEDSFGKKAPVLTVSQVRWLLEVMLPLQTFTLEDVLCLVKWTQRRNHEAYRAYRKRREEEG